MPKLVLMTLAGLACFVLSASHPNKPNGLEPHRQNTVTFAENKGQVSDQFHQPRPDVLFSGSANGMVYHLRTSGISYQLSRVDSWMADPLDKTPEDITGKLKRRVPDQVTVYRIDVERLNANKEPSIEKDDALPGYSNYYLPVCPEGIHQAKTYRGVTFKNVYQNIDLHYYEKNGALKYDYLVAAHGDYRQIRFQVKGADRITLKKDGSLILGTPLGEISEGAPIVYQDGRQLAAEWVVENTTLSFKIEDHDPALPMVIDPAVRVWGTYYGGASNEVARSVVTDPSGDVYMGGASNSTTGTLVATSGAHQSSYAGGIGFDGFLAKFSGSGARLWATYYGGNSGESVYSCATDASGNVYIAGLTLSTGTTLATAGSHQPTASTNSDAFLAKFNSAGVRQWGTYYGGSGNDDGLSCATDPSGNVYLSGYTSSTGTAIATAGSHQSNFAGSSDAFLVKFNASGVRQWGTFYGGSDSENGTLCTADGAGNVYIAGYAGPSSTGTAIATTGAHQTVHGGGFNDVFLAKFNSAGVRQWGTFYGGTVSDVLHGLSAEVSGNVYISGFTTSNTGTAIASPGSHQPIFAGGSYDAFLAKFNTSGVRQWGTYYGGTGSDVGEACSPDNAGNVYMAGWSGTNSGTAIATAGSHQSSYGGGTGDGFLVKFDAAGSRLWGTYYGGASDDTPLGCYANNAANVYMTGYSTSTAGIASPGSYQSTISGNDEAFLVRFSDCNYSVSASASPSTLCAGETLTLSAMGAETYTWFPGGLSGASVSVAPGASTNYTLYGTINSCTTTAVSSVSVDIRPLPTLTINQGAICSGNSFTIVPGGAASYSYSGGSAVVSPSSTSAYTVAGTAANGCTATIVSSVTVNPSPTISVNSGSICSGQAFTIVPSGADSYTYSGGSAIVSPAATTPYSVTGSSSLGCVSVNTAVANVTVAPTPTITVNSGMICAGGAFTIVPSGALTYTITGGSFTVSPLVTSSYSISGSSASGCQSPNPAVATVTVYNLPPLSITGSSAVCAGESVSLTATGAVSYTWSTNFVGQNLIIAPSTNTVYSVLAADANGCLSSGQKSVAVNPVPTLTVSGNATICEGASTSLLVTGTAFTYTWSNTVTGNLVTVSPLVSTIYTVTGTSVNGCTNSATQAVFVNTNPSVLAGANSTAICAGSAAVLNGSGAQTYTWSGGVVNNVAFYPSTSAAYTVTGTGANGCSNSATIQIVVNAVPVLTVQSSATQTICSGETVTLTASGANIYSWSGTNQITAVVMVTPSVTTDYTVTGTDANGCSNSAVITQSVDACLGLSQLARGSMQVAVYPNPNDGEFVIETESDLRVSILNGLGQVILSGELHAGKNKIDLSQYSRGVYFVKFENSNAVIRLIVN